MKNVTDKISDFFSSWWKVLGALATALYISFTMYDDIKDNKASIEGLTISIEDTKSAFKSELETIEGRSNKRYKRLLDELNEIRSTDKIKDRQIENLQKEVAFIQGQLKERL